VEVQLEATFDLRRRVLRAHAPDVPVANAEDGVPGAFHLAIVDDDEVVVAVGSFSPSGGGAVRLRGMAVEPSRRSQGLGGLLLERAVDRLTGAGDVTLLWANARVPALAFYERHGFVAVGEPFDEIGIPHVRVERPIEPGVGSAVMADPNEVPLFEATPGHGDVRGGVVVIQEAFGVNAHIQDVCRRFADERYHAVAPHIFHRTGGGVAGYGEFDKVIEHIKVLDDDKVLSDVDAALAHLQAAGIPPERTAIVGFCFGGRVSFLVSLRRRLGAGVGFYGGGIVSAGRLPFPPLVHEVAQLQTPWLGLFGDQDQSIPVADVERLREELDRSAPVEHGVRIYEGAGHGFFCDQRDSFHADAAADAWPRALDWIASHLA
jgi:carboxymethylenebutenolidase